MGGKVLLACGPEELRRKVLGKGHLKGLTSNTIKDAQDSEREMERVCRQGYAFSTGERDAEVAALAAPIYDRDGNVCAALSIAGPISRFSPEHNAKHLRILLASSERLSQMLGYDGRNTSPIKSV